MEFIATSIVGGDETQSFDVRDYKGTFGEFVKEVLTKYKSEWGKFEIKNTAWFVPSSFEYKHGELLNEIPQELLEREIESIRSAGGWSQMDYYLYLKNTENNGQERKITFEDTKKERVMETKDQELLLKKDLCARLPYKPQVVYNGVTEILSTLHIFDMTHFKKECVDIKPYLRPMSSMTEEERKEYLDITSVSNHCAAIDYLNAHHFDYRGLIPMGLALPAPEGMYDFK